MINGNACFAYFNKNWGIPLRYSSPTKILYAAAGAINFDIEHHRVKLAPVAMVHTV